MIFFFPTFFRSTFRRQDNVELENIVLKLLRRRDALTLRRERLDLDPLAAHRPASVKDQIAGRIMRLAVGDADKRIFSGDGELDAHGDHTASRYEAAAEFWPQYLRGQAYLKLKRGAEAAAEFQKILDHRGCAPLSPLYPLAHLGLARAATLMGETAKSRKVWENFFAAWKEADADLPILREAKREYELAANPR